MSIFDRRDIRTSAGASLQQGRTRGYNLRMSHPPITGREVTRLKSLPHRWRPISAISPPSTWRDSSAVRELRAREVIPASLKQIERLDPRVNAIVTVTAKQAAENPRAAGEAQARSA
jgi:hypothetical protein